MIKHNKNYLLNSPNYKIKLSYNEFVLKDSLVDNHSIYKDYNIARIFS